MRELVYKRNIYKITIVIDWVTNLYAHEELICLFQTDESIKILFFIYFDRNFMIFLETSGFSYISEKWGK